MNGQDWIQATLIIFSLFSAATDISFRRLPNRLNLLGILAGVALNTCCRGIEGLMSGLIGLGLGLAVGWIHVSAGLMGAGDAKMLAAMGALGGAQMLYRSSLWAVGLAGVYGFCILYQRQSLATSLKSALCLRAPGPAGPCLPFGTFLGLGILIELALKGQTGGA